MVLGDTGSELASFHTAIVEAAVDNCGDMVSGAGPGHNLYIWWWSGKPSSWRAYLSCRTLGTTHSYQRAKCFTTVEVNEPKTWVWEGFGEVMENYRRLGPTVECLRAGRWQLPHGIYGARDGSR